uniref:Cytochrome c oxidase subunit 2 n=1 Tax=Semele scabra TaxID=1125679 RepID=J3JR31_9BIVA|nr:cytochrome c oxidase subunit II [Semele scabra]AEV94310.1 cytochrome c oxidase subunit II [Semele scabra]
MCVQIARRPWMTKAWGSRNMVMLLESGVTLGGLIMGKCRLMPMVYGQGGLCDWGSSSGLSMVYLHDYLVCMCFMIMTVVGGVLWLVVPKSSYFCGGIHFRNVYHNNKLELWWTIIPIILIGIIGYPSFVELYSTGMNDKPKFVSVKVTGHQWYWNYEYLIDMRWYRSAGKVIGVRYLDLDLSGVVSGGKDAGEGSGGVVGGGLADSDIKLASVRANDWVVQQGVESAVVNPSMVGVWPGGMWGSCRSGWLKFPVHFSDEDFVNIDSSSVSDWVIKYDSYTLGPGGFDDSGELDRFGYRYGQCVDYPMVLPGDVDVEVKVTSGDVIHCWTLHGLSVKMDAVPGRVNTAHLSGLRPGFVAWGGCSEMCGVNHWQMSAEAEVLTAEDFIVWCLMWAYSDVDSSL